MFDIILQQSQMNLEPVITGFAYGFIVFIFLTLLIKVNYFNN